MEKEKVIKNKIIAISGQPVTGKSTTVKSLVKDLESQGYKKENIHTISTGNEFRRYFNIIKDFARNINNSEKLKEIAKTEEIKSIINNAKYRKIFLDFLINVKKGKIDISNLSVEEANNLQELSTIRKIVDTLIDDNIKNKGIEINKKERPNEIWIIDSRLAFHNIPEAFSVRLIATPEIAGKRLLADTSRGSEDNKYNSLEEAIVARENRKIGEQERYMKRYGINLEEESNYDLIIDTSFSKTEDISNTILKCLNSYINQEEFAKKWASPKTLLPLQRELDTLGMASYSFDEMLESMQKRGILPNKPIETVEVEGKQYIIEGHHRNFAAGYLGKTLVPYEVIAKGDDKIKKYGGATAKQRADSLTEAYLRGHEWMFEQQGDSFSYESIYPDIYEKLYQKENEER